MLVRNIKLFESLNTSAVQVTPSSKQQKSDAGPFKGETAVSDSTKISYKLKTDRSTKTNSGNGKSGIKIQRSNDLQVPNGKRLASAAEL